MCHRCTVLSRFIEAFLIVFDITVLCKSTRSLPSTLLHMSAVHLPCHSNFCAPPMRSFQRKSQAPNRCSITRTGLPHRQHGQLLHDFNHGFDTHKCVQYYFTTLKFYALPSPHTGCGQRSTLELHKINVTESLYVHCFRGW